MDTRIVIVLLPIAIAASWALFNIGRAAIGQFQQFLDGN